MGISIHSILQKQGEDGWKTIDNDVLQLMSSMARDFFAITDRFTLEGFPEGITPTSLNGAEEGPFIDDIYIGSYGHVHFSLFDFVEHKTEVHPNINVEETESGYTVQLNFKDSDDFMQAFVTLQTAYTLQYYDLTKYRMIVGYD